MVIYKAAQGRLPDLGLPPAKKSTVICCILLLYFTPLYVALLYLTLLQIGMCV